MLILLIIIGVIGTPYFFYKGWSAVHHVTTGTHKARAQYTKLKREQPNSSQTALSEAEFVDDYMSKRPGVVKGYFFFLLGVFFLILFFIGFYGQVISSFFNAATGGYS